MNTAPLTEHRSTRLAVKCRDFVEGKGSVLGAALYRVYGRVRKRKLRQALIYVVGQHEGSDIYSRTLRRIFSTYHGVEVGMYTHGGCFVIGSFPSGTRIGRYSSIALTARAMNANHPMNLRSSHGLFFDPELGLARERIIPEGRLTIGNDVWIGHNAVILPGVTLIADGAVIAAGAVVNKNVAPYAVVTGNPCRVVRYRFSQNVMDELLASRWWEKPLDELRPLVADFQRPLEEDAIR